MTLSDQLLAMANVLEEEGGAKSATAIREAVDQLDDIDEALDRIDELTRELAEEQREHAETKRSLSQYRDVALNSIRMLPPEDVERELRRHQYQQYGSNPGVSNHGGGIRYRDFAFDMVPSAPIPSKLTDIVTS